MSKDIIALLPNASKLITHTQPYTMFIGSKAYIEYILLCNYVSISWDFFFGQLIDQIHNCTCNLVFFIFYFDSIYEFNVRSYCLPIALSPKESFICKLCKEFYLRLMILTCWSSSTVDWPSWLQISWNHMILKVTLVF